MSNRDFDAGYDYERGRAAFRKPASPGPDTTALRDYFAGQALAGIGNWVPEGCGWPHPGEVASQHRRAQWAYDQADAMLRVRNGDKQET